MTAVLAGGEPRLAREIGESPECMRLDIGVPAAFALFSPEESPMAAASNIADKLIGTWTLVSLGLRMEDTGEVIEPFGIDPRGSIAFNPDGRMLTIVVASDRISPTTDAEMAAAFRGMMAYDGHYTIEGDRVVIDVEAAWHPAWAKTQQVRLADFDGDRLTLTTEPQEHPLYPGRRLRGIIVWTRPT